MREPTLTEVREYFKDAKVVKNYKGKTIDLENLDHRGIHKWWDSYYANPQDIISNVTLWDSKNGYAEIIKYKNKETKMRLNKLLIKQLRNGEVAVVNDGSFEELKTVLIEAFPDDSDEDIISSYRNQFGFISSGMLAKEWTFLEDENDRDKGDAILISVKDFFKEETKETDEEKLRKLEKAMEELKKSIEDKKFKVGDIVTITEIIGTGWLNEVEDKTVKIIREKTSYYGGEYFECKTKGGRTGGLHAKFRHATDKEIESFNKEEFKVGDLVFVEFKDNFYYENGKDLGICEVIEVRKSNEKFPYVIKSLSTGEDNAYRYLRKATPEEIKNFNKIKFKVGDIVVPLFDSTKGRTQTGHCRKKGKPYKILLVDKERGGVRLENDEGKEDGNGWIPVDEVRKATPEDIEKFKVKLPTINNFRGKELENVFKWGCFTISKKDVNTLIKLNIKSFVIMADDQEAEVTEEYFNQIKEYINKSK